MLISRMVDLRMELVKKEKEIRQLKEQSKEGLERIQVFMGNPGDCMNKAHFFDNDIKAEVQLSLPKLIAILVSFGHKMEAILGEIWKLVPGSQSEPIRPSFPSPKTTPQKEKPLVELKTPLPQRLVKELVAKIAKIEVLAALATKAIEKESEIFKTTSSEPSSQQRSSRKKKEPTLKSEEEEAESLEEEVESSSEEPELEEEVELATPSLEKKKRIETRSSDRKKPNFAFKTLVSLKRPSKTLKKGESFQKNPKRKQIVNRQNSSRSRNQDFYVLEKQVGN